LLGNALGEPEEILDETAAAEVADQVIGIVTGLQIPFLPFPVLMAEFTHDSTLSLT
jgi:hypothetical protein